LKRVLASYSDRTVMGDDLDSTLASLFKGGEGAAAPAVAVVQPMHPAVAGNAGNVGTAGSTPSGVAAAAEDYRDALQALRSGDWPRFGAQMQKLGEALGQPGGGPAP
jgi:uncharacterized membrane protein (UPF0182 family)